MSNAAYSIPTMWGCRGCPSIACNRTAGMRWCLATHCCPKQWHRPTTAGRSARMSGCRDHVHSPVASPASLGGCRYLGHVDAWVAGSVALRLSHGLDPDSQKQTALIRRCSVIVWKVKPRWPKAQESAAKGIRPRITSGRGSVCPWLVHLRKPEAFLHGVGLTPSDTLCPLNLPGR